MSQTEEEPKCLRYNVYITNKVTGARHEADIIASDGTPRDEIKAAVIAMCTQKYGVTQSLSIHISGPKWYDPK